ncbi:MAG: cbb3-type cytochrome c oxidase subunit I, partial [Gammaproteobacteria bacterium]|nr:cbb3-type cytochrome c oxidase subunit I [Gammaproteobacteria bacterium]
MDKSNTYNDVVVRQFSIMTVVWGVVGMLVGVIIAAQLMWPELNFDLPWTTFSRLRPLHTNAVIFAF